MGAWSAKGRIGRGRFWAGLLLLSVAALFVGGVPLIGVLALLGLSAPAAILYARRFHDMGRPGRLGLLAVLPPPLFIIAYLVGFGISFTQTDVGDGPLVRAFAWSLGHLPIPIALLTLGLTLWAGLAPGSPGENRHGPPVPDGAPGWLEPLVSPGGRTGRRPFWLGLLALLAAAIVLPLSAAMAGTMVAMMMRISHVATMVVPPLLLLIGVAYAWFCLHARRLHDAGRSARWIAAPLLLGAALLPLGAFAAGTAWGEPHYGPGVFRRPGLAADVAPLAAGAGALLLAGCAAWVGTRRRAADRIPGLPEG